MLWIVLAVIFLVAIFLLKTALIFKNKETYQTANQENGLSYSNATIQDLVNKDTDIDGILDWEEGLWGTDPTKKETTPGIPDSVAIEKLKTKQALEVNGKTSVVSQATENLTQTDKFSRELFATVTSLSQNGAMNQATADQIGSSLADQIQNSAPRKIYLLTDIKIINNDSVQSIKKYRDLLNSIYSKFQIKKGALDILQELMADEINTGILSEFDPLISQTQKTIKELVKMEVPQSLAPLHLDLINSSERLSENISDMKLLDSDSIRAMAAISQFGENSTNLQAAAERLVQAIEQKLNN